MDPAAILSSAPFDIMEVAALYSNQAINLFWFVLNLIYPIQDCNHISEVNCKHED